MSFAATRGTLFAELLLSTKTLALSTDPPSSAGDDVGVLWSVLVAARAMRFVCIVGPSFPVRVFLGVFCRCFDFEMAWPDAKRRLTLVMDLRSLGYIDSLEHKRNAVRSSKPFLVVEQPISVLSADPVTGLPKPTSSQSRVDGTETIDFGVET